MRTDLALQDLLRILTAVDEKETQALVSALLDARAIQVAGSGRSALIVQAFAMRLTQLGLRVFAVGGVSTPAFGPDDLLLLCSAAARAPSLMALAQQAAKSEGQIMLVTSTVTSPLSRAVKRRVLLPPILPSGVKPAGGAVLHTDDADLLDPSRALFEQAAFLYFDGVVSRLLKATGQDSSALEERRPNLA